MAQFRLFRKKSHWPNSRSLPLTTSKIAQTPSCSYRTTVFKKPGIGRGVRQITIIAYADARETLGQIHTPVLKPNCCQEPECEPSHQHQSPAAAETLRPFDPHFPPDSIDAKTIQLYCAKARRFRKASIGETTFIGPALRLHDAWATPEFPEAEKDGYRHCNE